MKMYSCLMLSNEIYSLVYIACQPAMIIVFKVKYAYYGNDHALWNLKARQNYLFVNYVYKYKHSKVHNSTKISRELQADETQCIKVLL